MAIGDLGTVIETRNFTTSTGGYPFLCHVQGNVYAVVWKDYYSDGWLKTFTIDLSNGDINETTIDSLEFAPDDTVQWTRIFHLTGDYYLITYEAVGNKPTMKTVTINSAGTIGAVIDTVVLDTSGYYDIIPCHVSGNIWAITYSERSGTDPRDGHLVTYSIVAGVFTAIDDYVYSALVKRAEIIKLSSTYYAILYNFWTVALQNEVKILTLRISDAGAITRSAIDRLTVDSNSAFTNGGLRYVTGNYYVLSYTKGGVNLATVEIDGSGNIGDSVIDTLMALPDLQQWDSLIPMGARFFVVVAREITGDVWVESFGVASNGALPASIRDSLAITTVGTNAEPMGLKINDDYMAVVWAETGGDNGKVATFGIEGTSILAPSVTTNPATEVT